MTDGSFVSEYTITVTGTNIDGFSIGCDFKLTIDTPCENGLTFTDPGQSNFEDMYTGVPQTFTLNPLEVTPSICASTINYKCTNVEGPDDADYTSLCDDFANNQLVLLAT